MTNNEIVTALRAVAVKYERKPVATFEINISEMATDAANCIERLCDEITRQKELIKEWKKIADIYEGSIASIKAEAVKELAERLKKRNRLYCTKVEDAKEMDFVIDNLVKEMVGEEP